MPVVRPWPRQVQNRAVSRRRARAPDLTDAGLRVAVGRVRAAGLHRLHTPHEPWSDRFAGTWRARGSRRGLGRSRRKGRGRGVRQGTYGRRVCAGHNTREGRPWAKNVVRGPRCGGGASWSRTDGWACSGVGASSRPVARGAAPLDPPVKRRIVPWRVGFTLPLRSPQGPPRTIQRRTHPLGGFLGSAGVAAKTAYAQV